MSCFQPEKLVAWETGTDAGGCRRNRKAWKLAGRDIIELLTVESFGVKRAQAAPSHKPRPRSQIQTPLSGASHLAKGLV
jgi:hypothetical protein